MNNRIVPTLSEDKWVNNNNIKLLRAYLYFIIADYSQTDTFKYEITSLKYIVHEYGNDPEKLKTELSKQLIEYLENFFSKVEATITKENISDAGLEVYDLNISAYDETGSEYTLATVLKIKNSKLTNIDEEINKLRARL